MKINSHNEWDTLREVIVGTAEHLTVGLEFPEGRNVTAAEFEKAALIAKKAVPDWYCDEIAEDLSKLCKALTDFGAKVKRPKAYGSEKLYSTPDWSASGKDLYNMRDLHIVVGNTVIASPSGTRSRYFEQNALYDIWYEYFNEGFTWIEAPKPRLTGTYIVPLYKIGEELVTEEDILHRKLSGGRGETWHRLTEDEIIFDAANITRLGADLLYLISSTGNKKGAIWLQSVLGDGYKVHTTDTYRSSHIDSTFLPLRPGLVLLNAARVKPENCPPLFNKWDKIYFSDVAPVPEKELDFQKNVRDGVYQALKAMDVKSEMNVISSPWGPGLNVLSLDADTVIVQETQIKLIKELESHRFTVIPVPARHAYTMLGALHCATLDTVRDSKLESYFD